MSKKYLDLAGLDYFWEQIKARIGAPIGSIKLFTTAVAPTGYLLCDGAAYSRTTYAALFAIIGTTYGVGDGSTTFNVPNLKGKVPVGRDSADTSFDVLGETGGAKTHTLTTAQMPSHTHNIKVYDTNGEFTEPGGTYTRYDVGGVGGTAATTEDGTSTTAIVAAGSGSSHNNLQPYIVLNYIIKY